MELSLATPSPTGKMCRGTIHPQSQLTDVFSKGIDLLIPFNRSIQFRRKQGICKGYKEFIDFLETFEDLSVSDKRRVFLQKLLDHMYKSFKKKESLLMLQKISLFVAVVANRATPKETLL